MAKERVKKIGILTAGGDAPGLNAAIRAVFCTARREGSEVIGIRNGFRGLIEGDAFPLCEEDIQGILTRGGTILGTSRDKPFKNPKIDEKTGLFPLDAIRYNWKRLSLDCLIAIGGNGTQTTAFSLLEAGFPVVGVAKTIDNDIEGADLTIGFDTACSAASDAIDRIHSTASSHSRIMIVEVMGHKTGHLALHAAVSGGAHAILIPEVPYHIESLAEKVMDRKERGKNFSIIVVAEGAVSVKEAGMDKKELKKARKAFRSSVSYRIACELEEATLLDARVTVLGYLQRGGIPSYADRILATSLGVRAAMAALSGESGKLVAMKDGKVVLLPLEEVAGKIKIVRESDFLYTSARKLGICFAD